MAARMGLSTEDFDRMTPRELAVYADAFNEKMEQEQEQRRQEIYLSALLTSQFVWAKGRRPSYEKVFGVKKRRKDMTEEEMLHMAEALNAMFGGEDLREEVRSWR